MKTVLVTQEYWWHAVEKRWALGCDLSILSPNQQVVPNTTSWVVLISPTYPEGTIKFYPALKGGLEKTFPHQSYNGTKAVRSDFRSGAPCLDTTNASLNRSGLDHEPREADQRLKWHFRRALQWLEQAAAGSLLAADDAFELPEFYSSNGSKARAVFREDGETYKLWAGRSDSFGWIEYFKIFPDWRHRIESNPLVIRRFLNDANKSLVEYDWGEVFSDENKTGQAPCLLRGVWLRLDQVPVLAPWEAPAIWGELEKVFESNGRNLYSELRNLFKTNRDGEAILTLIGFPIPSFFQKENERYHWQGIWLPPLSRGTSYAPGFRANETGYWQKDIQTTLNKAQSVPWINSQNWADEQIRSRGALPSKLNDQTIAIVGAGALGSCFAELLVRGGAKQLLVVDHDKVDIGNLSRHTLSLADVGFNKAERLRDRLKLLSPNVHVDFVSDAIPFKNLIDSDILRSCNVIVDCTASYEAVSALEQFEWRERKRFFSFSFGADVNRLFMFRALGESFPSQLFKAVLAPLMLEERTKLQNLDAPREYIGCWHGVFPARADEVYLAAICCLRYLIDGLNDEDDHHFAVYERLESSGTIGYQIQARNP